MGKLQQLTATLRTIQIGSRDAPLPWLPEDGYSHKNVYAKAIPLAGECYGSKLDRISIILIMVLQKLSDNIFTPEHLCQAYILSYFVCCDLV